MVQQYLTSLFEGTEQKAQEQQQKFEKGRDSDIEMWRGVLVSPDSSKEQREKAANEIGKLRNLKKGENPFNELAGHLNMLGEHLQSRGGAKNKVLGGLERGAGMALGTATNVLTGTPGQKYPSLPPISDTSAFPTSSQIGQQKENQDLENMKRGAATQRQISSEQLDAEFKQAEQVLGRPLTEDEKLQMLKLLPKTTGGVIWATDDSGKLVPMKDVGGKLQPIPTPQGLTPILPSTLPTTRTGSSTYDPATGTTTTASTSQKQVPGGKSLPRMSGGGSSKSAGSSRLSSLADAWEKGQVPSKKDLPGVMKWMKDNGKDIPEPLTAAAQKVVVETQPVLDQVQQLLGDIDKMNLGDKNTPGYLAWDRAKYAMGMSSPEGSLGKDIAGLSLGSVVEAAAALKGSSRSISALRIALEHTPNVWTDSPKLIKEKLQTIQRRLQDVVDDAKKFGKKGGLTSLKSIDDEIMEAVHGQPSQR